MRLFVITMAALSAVTVAACNEQKPAEPAAPAAPVETTEPAK